MPSIASLLIAFLGGVVSFISPCVIPLLPAYLSFLTGLSPEELSKQKDVRTVLVPALLFVLGFSVVFVALGATASVLGTFMRTYQRVFTIVGGVLVIVFGLFMIGLFRIPWLYSEKRLDLSKAKSFGKFSGFFMGMAFAAGWTPCIGPVLGSILALASTTASANQGIVLLLVYSLGLGFPFLLTALLFGTIGPYLKSLSKYSVIINRVAGVLLVIIGILMVTNLFGHLTASLSGLIPALEVGLPRIK